MRRWMIFLVVFAFSMSGCGQRTETDRFYADISPINPQGEQLTLEKVKELAQKGEDLLWNDFEQYRDEGNIGYGLVIIRYDIDENYYLLIGGGGGNPPLYIYLCSKADDSRIDIRTESIDDFIADRN